MSTLRGKPLVLVDQFGYLGINISSTEIDVNVCIEKAWTTIDGFSIIRQSNLSDKIKQEFYQTVAVSTQLYGCITKNLMKWMEEKTRLELYKNATCCSEKILEAAPQKIAAYGPLPLIKEDKQDRLNTADEERINS